MVLFEHVAGEKLRVAQHVAHGVDFSGWHVRRLEHGQGAGYRVRGAPGADGVVDFLRARHAAVVARQLRVARHVDAAHGQHQALEDGVAVAGDDDVFAVARRVGIRGDDAGQGTACALAHHARLVIFGHQRLHQVEHGFVQGHVDHLPFAVLASARHVAVAQGHHGADHAMQCRHGVADRHAHAHGRAVGKAGHIAQAAHRFADGAEAGQILHRPRLAKAGQAHHDERRFLFLELLVAEFPLFQHAGAVILDDDVRFQGQLARDGPALGRLQVQRDAFLVARLHRPPQRGAILQHPPGTDGVAAIGRLDLDHVGTEFGQHAGAERPRDQGAQFQDFDAR